ncbi:MAG TPA: cysteine desulfurase [Vicinamibacterales bacterium]|nr:cysteine desulfurase [Vicinamibacterales bacterium]
MADVIATGTGVDLASGAALDVERLRQDFPVLARSVRGRPLVYLDNAATTQKPRAVLDAVARYYAEENANVHRGVHRLSELATAAYEGARAKVARFLGAEPREIVFTRNATEAINLVAYAWGSANVRAGDEILLTELEHHSNIVPWQLLCERTGARLRVAPITDEGELPIDEFERRLGPRTRLVAVTHMSNALGTILPVAELAARAHAWGARVLVDGSQAAYHLPVDVRALGCDFYAISGHKLYGPTGIGVLWGRAELLEAMPPFLGGGDMIARVTWERTTYNVIPHRFEAGTPHIAGAVGLGAAVDYVAAVGFDRIQRHERALLEYATEAISSIRGLRIVGTAREKASILSFVMEGVHPHDIGTVVDEEGVAIRTGHHCAQPLMDRLGLPATARASLALYNTREEIDALARALERVRTLFR